MSYWLALSVYPAGRFATAGFTSHEACWHESAVGMNARTAAIPTPTRARTIAATAMRRVVRPSSARRTRSSDGRGRGALPSEKGRGRLLVIAAQDALNGWELPVSDGRRSRPGC